MAMSDEEYMAAYIKRMVRLNRAFEGQANKVSSAVSALNKDVIKRIEREFPKASATKLNQLIRKSTDLIITEYNNNIIPDVNNVSSQIVAAETAWTAGILGGYSGDQVRGVNLEKVARRAANKTYQGHTFRFWFNATKTGEAKKLEAILRAGYVNGATTDQVITQVSGFLGRADNDIKTLTRSFMQHSAIEARDEIFDQNQDLLEGYYWVSTLDSRTTLHICAIRDTLQYDVNHKPVGHSLPWGDGPGRIHFNCRSASVGKPKGSGDLLEMFRRPAINSGKNYERGDNVTKFGKARKPTAHARDKGIYDVTNVKGSTDYESWLRRQKSDYVADILKNKGAVADFKAGRMSLLDFVQKGTTADLNLL